MQDWNALLTRMKYLEEQAESLPNLSKYLPISPA